MRKLIRLHTLFQALTVAGISVLLLSSCRSENPPLTGPPKQPVKLLPKIHPTDDQAREGLSVPFDPKVDILFVIDDSWSMRYHQINLKDNLHHFVDAFAKVSTIDFHIAYTNVYDRTRYGTKVPQTCGALTITTGRENWSPNAHNWDIAGTLQPMLDKNGKLSDRRFVTKDDDYISILSNTFDPDKNKILLKQLLPKPDDLHPDPKLCPYGPEEEELFTPLVNAVEGLGPVADTNKGFRREGAFFVAILLSDAKDASGLTPEEVAARIAHVVGQDKEGHKRFRIFSVVLKPGTKIDPDPKSKCHPDPVWAESKIDPNRGPVHQFFARTVTPDENPLANLARLTEDGSLPPESQILSICDDYGDALAKYGAQVRKDVLHDVVIELAHRPQITNDPQKRLSIYLQAKGNPQRILLKESEQWNYNPQDVTVTVYAPKVDWKAYPDATIHVSYTPVVDESSRDSIPQ